MISVVLQILFGLASAMILVYMIRHLVFTFTVLKRSNARKGDNFDLTVQGYEPFVTYLIPAHNEARVIQPLLEKMERMFYPRNKLQVIVIDDASWDNTGEIVREFSMNCKYIELLKRDRKTGGRGKAAALNDALKYAKGEIIMILDADYLPPEDLTIKLVKYFVDPKVGAVQGRPVVRNEKETFITRLVALERIGGFRVDQQARDFLGLMPQFGGTVAGFRKKIIEEIGGFDPSMLTEDTDLTFEVYLQGSKIRYAGEAECYEEAVKDLRSYWRQRHRWAKGHMQVCFKHVLPVLKSRLLTFREKIDGLLLLHIYFLPVVTFFAALLGTALILLGTSPIFNSLWFFVAISFYSFAGNFAPFYEVGIGAYLDGRTRIQWLSPLLVLTFFLSMMFCTLAFLEILLAKMRRRNDFVWDKTDHFGMKKSFVYQTGGSI